MSSAKVLPSAPVEIERQLYLSLPAKEISVEVEVEYYRLVLNKYKKVRKVIYYSLVCLGTVTVALSSGAVATSLTGVGIVISAPVAAVAVVSGAASTSLSVISKKFERIINKHSRIHYLAVAKHDSINSSVSQALNDNRVSDTEFQLITREFRNIANLKTLYAQTLHKNKQSHKFELNFERKNTKFSLSRIKNS